MRIIPYTLITSSQPAWTKAFHTLRHVSTPVFKYGILLDDYNIELFLKMKVEKSKRSIKVVKAKQALYHANRNFSGKPI